MIEELVKWLLQYVTVTELFLIGIALGMLVTTLGVLHLTRKRDGVRDGWFKTWRNTRMERRERAQYVKEFTADLITSSLEDACSKGEIKRHEVDNIYRQLSQQLGNNNFMQKKAPPPADALEPVITAPRVPLKVRIWTRLENWKQYIPVNIPGPKPGEETVYKTEPKSIWRRRTTTDSNTIV